MSVWVSAYLAVGGEAVGVAKIQTSTRVALAEKRANCTLPPEIVAPSVVAPAAGAKPRSMAAKTDGRTAARRSRPRRLVFMGCSPFLPREGCEGMAEGPS